MPKKVPLVVHLTDGTKKGVGEAEVDDAGSLIKVTIDDAVLANRLFGGLKGISVDEASETQRQNVFDQEKES